MLGDHFLAYMTLALGASLALGTGAAVVRPRTDPETGDVVRAPLGRSLIQIVIGGVAAIWALATLVH